MIDQPSDSATPISARLFSGWGRDILIANGFLTRLPFQPVGGVAPGGLARAGRAFPIIGLIVGLIAGAGLMAAAELNLHPLACALIGLAVAAVVTGGLHEDGLADVADGFGGGQDREAKLRIMRDSRIGAFGVLALIFSVGIRAAVLGGLPGPGLAAASLAGAAILSRAVLPAFMHRTPLARSDGLASEAGTPDLETAAIALGLGALGAVVFLGFGAAAFAVISVLGIAAAVAWFAGRQIGGYTGDVLGAAQQGAEMAVLIVAVAMLS